MSDRLNGVAVLAREAWVHLPEDQREQLEADLAAISGDDVAHLQAVIETDREFPHLLRWNTHSSCGEFLQRALLKLPGFGHLTKNAGENGVTFPNGERRSHDAIALPDGRRYDIINSAAAHPAPGGPTWIVIPPEAWRSSNVYAKPFNQIFISDAPTTTTKHVAELGWSWFC